VTVITACSPHRTPKTEQNSTVSCDLDSIRKRGKLVAITDFNSTDYFIYRGEPMGFNYELLKSFSDNIGIDLEIIPENRPDQALHMLKSGAADLLAYNLDSSSNNDVRVTDAIGETRLVLIQLKPKNWSSMSSAAIDAKLIRNQAGLTGKTIYVPEGSSYAKQLISMAKETGNPINIIEVPYESEKLIKNVARGVIDYTICDENLAIVNSMYFPGIDVITPVSLTRKITWGIRKNNSDHLLSALDRWISTYKLTGSYALLYAKYFKNARSIAIVNSELYTLSTGKVSPYDDIIKKFSTSINWDWRLLASLICQESHFNPNVESYKGAFGLMQIMPETGKNYGIDITSSPENNVKAGIRYIKWLSSIFSPKISDEKERINFILAAYNAGPGHVLDAMKLAEKNGMDPGKWDGNVAIWLLKKSQPKYYNDSVVKSGYFKGIESVRFVSQIMERYEHYKNIIPEQKVYPY
jgi:membrane-bound lytic murein transglycosylase F